MKPLSVEDVGAVAVAEGAACEAVVVVVAECEGVEVGE